jgi:transposase InsO family protein
MAAPLLQLQRLSQELGNPGVEGLWAAVKKRKLELRKAQVISWVKSRSEKQVLGAPQRAAGKTVSEDDNRGQMDLVDVAGKAGDWKFFLVYVNVFDRMVYAKPLTSKEPLEVMQKLKAILSELPNKPGPRVISSDNGPEFKSKVMFAMLGQRKITQRFKDAGDINALGLIDRQIGLLKARLAELSGRNKKTWSQNLPAALQGLNATPKPDVLHGAAPKDVAGSDEVRFMLYQDQAAAIQQNQKVANARKARLEETMTFRPQLELGKFKRNFQATYGDPKTATSISAGRVKTGDGQSYPLKQIRVVPVGATAVEGPRSNAGDRRKGIGAPILNALEQVLGDEPMSLTKASGLVKDELQSSGKDYNLILKNAKAKLIDLIRLDTDRFQLVERPHGKQTWYYVSSKK